MAADCEQQRQQNLLQPKLTVALGSACLTRRCPITLGSQFGCGSWLCNKTAQLIDCNLIGNVTDCSLWNSSPMIARLFWRMPTVLSIDNRPTRQGLSSEDDQRVWWETERRHLCGYVCSARLEKCVSSRIGSFWTFLCQIPLLDECAVFVCSSHVGHHHHHHPSCLCVCPVWGRPSWPLWQQFAC